jgi:hypothetical protein
MCPGRYNKITLNSLPRGCHISTEFVSALPQLYYIDMIGSSYTEYAFKALTKRVASLAFGFDKTGSLREAVLLGANPTGLRHLRIKSSKHCFFLYLSNFY